MMAFGKKFGMWLMAKGVVHAIMGSAALAFDALMVKEPMPVMAIAWAGAK